MDVARLPRTLAVHAARAARPVGRRVRTELDLLATRRGGADLAIFHEYAPPPSGGGNQFIRALSQELARQGLELERNRISPGTPACLFNSFNFDFHRLRRFARRGPRLVHRVDGPIGTYRGYDDGTDRRLGALNERLADATVLQSRYSLEKHEELGLRLREPVVIPNAPDPAIFHPPPSRPPLASRRVRVVASSWSDNPRKGADVLAWLDRHLDPDRYELTFVGRTPARLERAMLLAPVPSEELADILRGQDVYVAASRDDPCSNALLEALACGLPAAYLRSGGHPELVGDAGVAFEQAEGAGEALDRLVRELEQRRGAIRVPELAVVTGRYREVLGL